MPVRRDEAIFGPHFPPDRNIHGHLHGNANRHAVKEIYDPDFHYDLAPDVHGYGLVDLSRI
jgi:hypothetical protein